MVVTWWIVAFLHSSIVKWIHQSDLLMFYTSEDIIRNHKVNSNMCFNHSNSKALHEFHETLHRITREK